MIGEAVLGRSWTSGGCAEGKIGSRLVVEDQSRLNGPNFAALAVWLLSGRGPSVSVALRRLPWSVLH